MKKEIQQLTEGERRVYKLMANFHENDEIAEILHCSRGTVKAHVSSILKKLCVYSRAEAVIAGLKLGILELDNIHIRERVVF